MINVCLFQIPLTALLLIGVLQSLHRQHTKSLSSLPTVSCSFFLSTETS